MTSSAVYHPQGNRTLAALNGVLHYSPEPGLAKGDRFIF